MFKRIFLAAWLALASAVPAFATSVLPLDLVQVIDQAAVAFQGTVVSTKTGRDPQSGMLVTLTTFRVDDVLKGDVPASYTIKQIGGEDVGSGLKFKVQGVPTYAVGQSFVLFMHGVSSAGFTSPVGLSQGRFQVMDGDAGAEVESGRDFDEIGAGLELPAAKAAKSRKRMGLADFKSMVRKHAGAQR